MSTKKPLQQQTPKSAMALLLRRVVAARGVAALQRGQHFAPVAAATQSLTCGSSISSRGFHVELQASNTSQTRWLQQGTATATAMRVPSVMVGPLGAPLGSAVDSVVVNNIDGDATMSISGVDIMEVTGRNSRAPKKVPTKQAPPRNDTQTAFQPLPHF